MLLAVREAIAAMESDGFSEKEIQEVLDEFFGGLMCSPL